MCCLARTTAEGEIAPGLIGGPLSIDALGGAGNPMACMPAAGSCSTTSRLAAESAL